MNDFKERYLVALERNILFYEKGLTDAEAKGLTMDADRLAAKVQGLDIAYRLAESMS